ncbi:hypothetical protein [Luteolibacter marinus]|uniref:hypothetical protein n=1 Tax=Luteolibacter marinus TaxID=2776705 RepID=UPI001868E2EA|nr:hypothetical protein [Luteolibacter marinus]
MKSSLVPIACGTALALMVGATAAHWSSVRDMAALAAALPQVNPAKPVSPALLPDDGLTREAKGFLADARREAAKHVVSPQEARNFAAAPKGSADARIERLLKLLEGTVEQNQELREQIALTNRDLSELRFQVDSYDGQFRPLKVEQESNYYYDDGSAGVLPPLESP